MNRRRLTDHPLRVPDPPTLDPAQVTRDIERVATNVRSRLHSLGVPALDADTPADLVAILDTIERFENVVRGRGGDLMVDEPPPGSRPQPDGELNVLPSRARGEPATLYIERLERAIDRAAGAPA